MVYMHYVVYYISRRARAISSFGFWVAFAWWIVLRLCIRFGAYTQLFRARLSWWWNSVRRLGSKLSLLCARVCGGVICVVVSLVCLHVNIVSLLFRICCCICLAISGLWLLSRRNRRIKSVLLRILLGRCDCQFYITHCFTVSLTLLTSVPVTFDNHLFYLLWKHGHPLVLALRGNNCEVDLIWVDHHGWRALINFLSVTHLRLPIIIKHVSLTTKWVHMPWG